MKPAKKTRLARKQCWRDRGLTEEGARRADRVLKAMEAIVADVGSPVAEAVLNEATFRVEALPGRTDSFRRRYLKANGGDDTKKR
jgi:hypothetical protein